MTPRSSPLNVRTIQESNRTCCVAHCAGKFAARLDGRELRVRVKPFLDAARVLLAEGVWAGRSGRGRIGRGMLGRGRSDVEQFAGERKVVGLHAARRALP